jgi:hypothetical protein
MSLAKVGAPVWTKLANVLGPEEAGKIVRDVLLEMGLVQLRTPDERFRFGERLVLRGGMLQVMGRSIQTQALLHGANLL